MSAALPSLEENCCPLACEDVLVQNIPGPAGEDGDDGTNGADGVSAVTTLGFAFTMPAELASDTATLASTAGLVIGENVYVQGLGTLQVTAILSTTQATFKNVEDTATSAYSDNAAPGTVAPTGTRVGPTGLQGGNAIITGVAAGGDLKGTYPNPQLAIPSAFGALAVGNGTDAVSLSAGLPGYILVNDPTAFPATRIGHKRVTPVGGDTNAATDRLPRLSSGVGMPIPIEVSRASLKDPGGLGGFVLDETTGDVRGTDAIDLQVSRNVAGVGAVASGNQSVLLGGQDNVASGTRAVVGGGEDNAASGQESVIVGGDSNKVDSTQSAIVGGEANTILGGSANESFIGGGSFNEITGNGQAVIAGGTGNEVTSQYGAILGGSANLISGIAGAIVGGSQATADKYGQRAFSAGRFAAQADCQQSDLIWRIATTGIVGNTEMFLDGASLRATIAIGRTVLFDILITVRSSTGTDAAWQVKGLIHNNGGTTAIVGSVTNTLIADGSGGSAFGTLANVPLVTANDAADALIITVTNPSATNLRWCAHGRLVELGY